MNMSPESVRSQPGNYSICASAEESREQVLRVAKSLVFRNAKELQHFLEFVALKHLEDPKSEVKEYQIATQVFGRSPDFDPALDTIVRTQAHRLRLKLKEYYEGDGAADEILIEIPKGHYRPSFTRRSSLPGDSKPPVSVVESPDEVAEEKSVSEPDAPLRRQWSKQTFWLLGLGVAACLVFGAGLFFGSKLPQVGPTRSEGLPAAHPVTSEAPDPLHGFWADFLGKDMHAVMAYSNAVFLVTETGDLLGFKGGAVDDRGALVGYEMARRSLLNPGLGDKAGPLFYEDGYTGTGEVVSVHRLTRLFAEMGAELLVKRSRLVTVDDLKQNGVIFVGSPYENNGLAELKLKQDFVFEPPSRHPNLWRARILNVRPAAGEKSFYETERDPATLVLRVDYALFSVLPGLNPSRKIICLAGLTTSGTEGAAEFATSSFAMRGLLEALGPRVGGTAGSGFPPYFECILRVEVTKGLDVLAVSCVKARALKSAS